MIRRLAVALAAVCMLAASAGAELTAERFADPPEEARPWVYWWWLEGAATPGAITADLEAMKANGIGGATLMDAGWAAEPAPSGPQFPSDEWLANFRHTVQEASRLGMEITANLCSGWVAGGPWIPQEHAVTTLVSSRVSIEGGRTVDLPLPLLRAVDGFLRDVAVVAIPDRGTLAPAPLRVTDGAHLVADGSPWTAWRATDGALQLDYAKPHEFEWIKLLAADRQSAPVVVRVFVSEDGKTFREHALVETSEPVWADPGSRKPMPHLTPLSFPLVTARSLRLEFEKRDGGNVDLAEVAAGAGSQRAACDEGVVDADFKSGARGFWFWRDPSSVLAPNDTLPPLPGGADCAPGEVIDLTAQVTDGHLLWDAPPGRWVVLRFGRTLLDARTSMSSLRRRDLQADFFDPNATALHFRNTTDKLAAAAGPLAGKTFTHVHADSWEVHEGPAQLQPNWTPAMPEEFLKRRGYDLTPWLPALARVAVGSREETERFLADFRRTIGDLFADSFYGTMSRTAKPHGLGTHPESGYGTAPMPHVNGLECQGRNDIPMAEFWKRATEPTGNVEMGAYLAWCDSVKQASSAAHIYGRRIVQAEAFTMWPINGWDHQYPWAMKDIADRAFCSGVNRVVLHKSTLAVDPRARPAFQWSAAGVHWDRSVTWWKEAGALFRYMARCSDMLRQGDFVADLAYYVGDAVPSFVPAKTGVRPALPAGFDFDGLNGEILRKDARVEDGQLVLRSGMRYRLLVLPERYRYASGELAKIRDLVHTGLHVLGPRPDPLPRGLGGPDEEAKVAALVEELWGSEKSGTTALGKGSVSRGMTPGEVLRKLGVAPDCDIVTPGVTPPDATQRLAQEAHGTWDYFDFIHRRTQDADIYFVANLSSKTREAVITFRVPQLQPEIRDPVTGKTWDATDFEVLEDGRVRVPLAFAPRQSFFLVFQRPAGEPDGRPNLPQLAEIATLEGPWQVRFDPALGGPAEPVVFERLDDWTSRAEEGIRFYSGTAVYKKTFETPKSTGRVFLDLGTVHHAARVTLNGRELGTVWCAPWHVEITSALRPGPNVLEISAVNLWNNRLLGDAELAAEKRITFTNTQLDPATSRLLPSGLLGPVRLLGAP